MFRRINRIYGINFRKRKFNLLKIIIKSIADKSDEKFKLEGSERESDYRFWWWQRRERTGESDTWGREAMKATERERERLCVWFYRVGSWWWENNKVWGLELRRSWFMKDLCSTLVKWLINGVGARVEVVEPWMKETKQTKFPRVGVAWFVKEGVYMSLCDADSKFCLFKTSSFREARIKIKKFVSCISINVIVSRRTNKTSSFRVVSVKIKNFPLPGIEPGSPGWKPDILTAGRQRILMSEKVFQFYLFNKS